MATTKTVNVEEPKKVVSTNRDVTINIPRGASFEETYVYVCVNGKAYTIPKGVDCTVPLAVAEIIEQKVRAEYHQEIERKEIADTDVKLR